MPAPDELPGRPCPAHHPVRRAARAFRPRSPPPVHPELEPPASAPTGHACAGSAADTAAHVVEHRVERHDGLNSLGLCRSGREREFRARGSGRTRLGPPEALLAVASEITGSLSEDGLAQVLASLGEHSMPVLPDIRAPGLDVVFCGTPGERSAERGHYFAGRGNRIWHQIRAAKRWSTLLANNRAKAAVEQLWCSPSSLQLTIG